MIKSFVKRSNSGDFRMQIEKKLRKAKKEEQKKEQQKKAEKGSHKLESVSQRSSNRRKNMESRNKKLSAFEMFKFQREQKKSGWYSDNNLIDGK